jgi:hypothetical protein
MALSRFVLQNNVTVNAGTPAAGSFGSASPPGAPSAWSELWPVTFQRGQVIWADSAAGTTTGAQLLYQAIGAGNLRAFVAGQDDGGRDGLAN